MSELTVNYRYIRFEKWIDLFGNNYWRCHTKKGTTKLGEVYFNDQWRCWEYIPQQNTAYTVECLEDIAKFLSQLNKAKK